MPVIPGHRTTCDVMPPADNEFDGDNTSCLSDHTLRAKSLLITMILGRSMPRLILDANLERESR